MSVMLVQVIFEPNSGLTEDRCINTFNFDMPGGQGIGDAEDITNALAAFYQGFDQFLSGNFSDDVTVRFYDRSDDPPRVPWFEAEFGVTHTANQVSPEELALCISFQAEKLSGLDQAKRRGRVYIGPLNNNAQGDGVNGNRPAPGFVTALANAGEALIAESVTATDWEWGVWSTTDQALRPIENGWVDNAFDVQRRRGVRPTSRAIFNSSP